MTTSYAGTTGIAFCDLFANLALKLNTVPQEVCIQWPPSLRLAFSSFRSIKLPAFVIITFCEPGDRVISGCRKKGNTNEPLVEFS